MSGKAQQREESLVDVLKSHSESVACDLQGQGRHFLFFFKVFYFTFSVIIGTENQTGENPPQNWNEFSVWYNFRQLLDVVL